MGKEAGYMHSVVHSVGWLDVGRLWLTGRGFRNNEETKRGCD